MLSVVGTAVAINPDSALRDVARERGWQIRDFRTGRKAAKIWVPPTWCVVLAGIAAVSGGRCGAAPGPERPPRPGRYSAQERGTQPRNG